jgi:hypothetical protein
MWKMLPYWEKDIETFKVKPLSKVLEKEKIYIFPGEGEDTGGKE